MIIDSHSHMGYDYVFDVEETKEELLRAHKEYGVTTSIVQPFISRPYLEDTRKYHNEIFKLTREYPGEFFGMASINPHFRPEDYFEEAKRCIKELDFVGLKITPIAHAVNPGGRDGQLVFEAATELGVPVMVHTGAGMPFSDPAKLLSVLPKFDKIPVVLAHAGTDLLFTQALYLAKAYDNVYLEPSWVNIMNVENAIKTVGSGKVMFSSDHAQNIPVELAKYRTLLKNQSDLDNVLFKTANEVFKLGLKYEEGRREK